MTPSKPPDRITTVPEDASFNTNPLRNVGFVVGPEHVIVVDSQFKDIAVLT